MERIKEPLESREAICLGLIFFCCNAFFFAPVCISSSSCLSSDLVEGGREVEVKLEVRECFVTMFL